MTYDQLIRHYGTMTEAARALGIKPPSVFEWKRNGIPLPRQAQYQILTGGKLKAEQPGKSAA